MAMDIYHAKEALHKIENVFKQHFKHIHTIEEKEVNSLRATFIVISYDIKFYIAYEIGSYYGPNMGEWSIYIDTSNYIGEWIKNSLYGHSDTLEKALAEAMQNYSNYLGNICSLYNEYFN